MNDDRPGHETADKTAKSDKSSETSSVTSAYNEEEESIKWIHIIFLPFQLWWQIIVLFAVFIKCFMGPLSAIFPILDCPKGEPDEYFFYLEFTVRYLVEPLYIIDTFLYIVHRQVTDEAMKREHLPKPGYQIILDVISLVPLYTMFADDLCATDRLWPNVLNFNQFFLIYRVVKFFSLNTSHNFLNLLIGYSVMYLLVINALNCFFILYTFHGLCGPCGNYKIHGWMDWKRKREEMLVYTTNKDLGLYLAGFSIVTGLISSDMFDEYKPVSYIEISFYNALMVLGFIIIVFIITPKLFCESLLRVQRIYIFHPRIKRIVEETKRRNPSPTAYRKVQTFYSLIWTKRHGIISMPKTINELPETLKLDIRQDLVWPVFHHSPTFRKATLSYKRWLCQRIRLNYKQPGERFFSGPHCYSNLYYIKAGIVQLLSTDDTTAALLSLSGGTLLGDICFLVPPKNRKVIARCLTYCEVLTVARADIVTSLHKFPEDRRVIMKLCREKMKHAYELYDKKEKIKGRDRTEDEGIAWVKNRWWQIFDAINKFKFSSNKSKKKWELPTEEHTYHCPKYIGQLVLCEDIKLQTTSLFAKVTFPWILAPHSIFTYIWRRIVFVTVILVLLILPPNIVREKLETPAWYLYFHDLIDIIYVADVIVNLLTGIEVNKKMETNFIFLLVNRCKDIYFIMDVLSTPGIEFIVGLTKNEPIIYLTKFNRLLKVYILFVNKHERIWRINREPLRNVLHAVIMIQFCFIYIVSFFLYLPVTLFSSLEESVFYGNLCIFTKVNCSKFVHFSYGIFSILVGWVMQSILHLNNSTSIQDLVLGNLLSISRVLLHLFVKFKLISALYLKYQENANYQFFVTNLKNHYIRLKIHPDLLKRLNSYLDCHWRYYNGMDILRPNLLKDEPFDIYLKLHGDVAENIIKQCPAFLGAGLNLVKELADKSKFIILPINTTLIMYGVALEYVTWVASGVIKCEYRDDNGETRKIFIDKGQMLATPAVFLGRPPLRTYSTASDVEILNIKIQDFFSTIRRYPVEWSYFKTCEEELGPTYGEMFVSSSKANKDYQKSLRQRVFQARQSVSSIKESSKKNILKDLPVIQNMKIPGFFKEIRTNPESKFFLYWLAFRAIVFYISMIAETMAGASLYGLYQSMVSLRNVCYVIRVMDIIIKLFIPYYDDRGLVISKINKCALHYLTRGFVIDIVSFVFGWHGVTRYLFSFNIDATNTVAAMGAEYLGIYLFVGYFDYISNRPSMYTIFPMLIKWQLIILLSALSFAGVMVNFCVDKDTEGNLISPRMLRCWLPIYMGDPNVTSFDEWHNVFVQSISLVQCFFMGNYLGAYDSRHQGEAIVGLHLIAAVCFWYFTCYSQTLLMLAFRGDTMFHHGIGQLKSFLTGERVEKHLIHKTMNYFAYWWKRTAGVDMRILINERVGVVFRQDLCYYFFKRTFKAVDTLLHGGEALERQLASRASELYLLPGEDIVREMDLCTNLYIVHRGRISISKNNKQIAVLSKGSIIGQLDGAQVRPIRITGRALDRADLLMIPLQEFHQIVTDEVRNHIANSPQSKFDYMGLRKALPENPYNSIKYLLRGSKVIKLPWMEDPETAETNKWYARWLLLVWAIAPIVTAATVILISTFYNLRIYKTTLFIIALDLLQVAYLYTEFYTMELEVVDARCQYRYIRWKKFKSFGIYLDVLSLVLPYTTVFFVGPVSQLTRLLRLYTVYFYHRDFCGQFEAKTKSAILKIVLWALVLHAFVCGWIVVACKKETFPLPYLAYHSVNLSLIDLNEWDFVLKQRKYGCTRLLFIKNITDIYGNMIKEYGFISPVKWQADYLIALHFVIILFVNANVDVVLPVNMQEMYYKMFAWHLLYLVRLFITSIVVSSVYTKYREMYNFDYAVNCLLEYLKYNDISLYLRQSIRTYTDLLWKRQSGNWLPEITHQAPFCLREDIFCSLYIHHLLTPLLFQNLPMYFLRQLVVRLKRIVIFPGKYVVEEGDINPCIYFIHEGEVEKWFTDASGESRMAGVLTINGVFGIIPGLFPNTPYRFSYYTRTVVDLVYLQYSDWQDLLNGYPDVKYELYVAAMKMRTELYSTISKTSLATLSKTSLRSASKTSLKSSSKTSLKS